MVWIGGIFTGNLVQLCCHEQGKKLGTLLQTQDPSAQYPAT